MKHALIPIVLSAAIVGSTPWSSAWSADKAPRHQKHTPKKVVVAPRSSRYPVLGRAVQSLPAAHVAISVGSSRFFYHGGIYYQQRGADYVVVTAPIGARVRVLPSGYTTWKVGPRRYYYVNATYYLWDSASDEYVVVDAPDDGVEVADALPATYSDLIVYPAAAQTDEQRVRDRFECHLWAVDETGRDPTLNPVSEDEKGRYQTALSACLEGRGYVVR